METICYIPHCNWISIPETILYNSTVHSHYYGNPLPDTRSHLLSPHSAIIFMSHYEQSVMITTYSHAKKKIKTMLFRCSHTYHSEAVRVSSVKSMYIATMTVSLTTSAHLIYSQPHQKLTFIVIGTKLAISLPFQPYPCTVEQCAAMVNGGSNSFVRI